MSLLGVRSINFPFISGPERFAARWLPTILVASASAWAVVLANGPGSSPPTIEAVSPIREIGRGYGRDLAGVYSGAWLEGATALERGSSVAESLGVVEKAWRVGRVKLFDRKVAPVFSEAVPEGRPAEETSTAERMRLSALWREFAAGLAAD